MEFWCGVAVTLIVETAALIFATDRIRRKMADEERSLGMR